jgi:hypothetical protein
VLLPSVVVAALGRFGGWLRSDPSASLSDDDDVSGST